MNNPLVTIYITNYNYGKFIRKSIESALEQTLHDFELIIIDDGSTDNSKEIIEEYRANPKVAIVYQKNKGLNITNNIAMRLAKGKYLMRLDADDFLEPSAIEVMSARLETDESLGLIFPDYYYVNAENVRTGEERRHDFEKEVSLYDQPAHGACTMIRLEYLRNLGGYNESFTCQDGYDLWIKFIMHHKVSNINQPLFSYRRHGSNLTTNEERLLQTRKKIKEIFVDSNLAIPNTIAIIPARNTFIGDVNWPLRNIRGKSVLQRKVETCVKAKKIKSIVITTSDTAILDHCREWINQYDNVYLIERPKEFSATTVSLTKTLLHALEFVQEKLSFKIEAVMQLSLEYPFTSSEVVEDAINTLVLFKANAVLSVRPDNRMYYQHNGHTLRPILDQEKFMKVEREAIYKGAGGVVIGTVENLRQNKHMLVGSISHIVVDQRTAFGVYSNFDLNLFDLLAQENELIYQ
jgi:glycosyltransferase involved in cell wall biosynthesis